MFSSNPLDSDQQEPFSEQEISLVDPENVPHHVAIIMDGNRRWAQRRGHSVEVGHQQGTERLSQVVRAASSLGIRALTVYAFSTENWKRSSFEVDSLMSLLERYLRNKREVMVKEGVKLETIGDLSRLPENVRNALDQTKKATENGDQIDLILALNYGGRDEIRRACLKLIEALEKGSIEKKEITESLFSQNLDTAQWPDPDILIRSSGDIRISNFLVWQISYSEIYYTNVLWPDFSKNHLLQAVLEFQKRKRRFGS